MDLDEIKRGLRAEIKKRENEQYFTFQCNVRQMCKDVLAKIEEQETEIAELKAKLEDAKATAYADSVDAGMRERRLKRALYKACANWAHHRVFVRFNANEKRWENMERKCLAMAEKFK